MRLLGHVFHRMWDVMAYIFMDIYFIDTDTYIYVRISSVAACGWHIYMILT